LLRDDEDQRAGEDSRDIEKLELHLHLKANAIAAARPFSHLDDIPYRRRAGAGGGKEKFFDLVLDLHGQPVHRAAERIRLALCDRANPLAIAGW
jgi:hypothetical protein